MSRSRRASGTPAQQAGDARREERKADKRRTARTGKPVVSPEAVEAATQLAAAYGDDATAPRNLPPHPGGEGKRWQSRHVTAARMRAAGWTWPRVAEVLGVKHTTVTGYPQTPGWELLYGHFRASYVAKLEDELLEPALSVLRRLLDPKNEKVSDFAQLQAAQTVLNQRALREKTLDKYLTALTTTKGGNSGRGDEPTSSSSSGPTQNTAIQVVINNVIPEPSERRAAAETPDAPAAA